MTVRYTFSDAMTIVFDRQYELHIKGDLDKVLEAVKASFNAYRFYEADVILDSTGELVMMCRA